MNYAKVLISSILAGAAVLIVMPNAYAQGRPWLCRDKPVFSSNQPMSFTATAGRGPRWELYMMQFTPEGSHDGFDIERTVPLGPGGSESGTLAAGRYFTVALHRSGGEWICPDAAVNNPGAGEVGNLCFSTEEGGCTVRLRVINSAGTH